MFQKLQQLIGRFYYPQSLHGDMSLPHPFNFDRDKAIEVILYIANRAPISDLFHTCKILYYADRMHLEEYGRFICGDHYIAMKHGPVPSHIYDILKDARINDSLPITVGVRSVSPHRVADIESLSESDIECLNNAIKQYGAIKFEELSVMSHDSAWKAADQNDMIPIESIAATLRDGDAIIQHLRSQE